MTTQGISTTYINSNWKIKVFGTINGTKVNTLVGVSGLISKIGFATTSKLFRKMEGSLEDKTTFKLRRGIKVTFYTF